MPTVLSKGELGYVRALTLYEGSGERWDQDDLCDSHETLRLTLTALVEFVEVLPAVQGHPDSLARWNEVWGDALEALGRPRPEPVQ